MSRSERIVTQLGMSHGTAANRLRKNILFSFAQRLKEDICFKCGKQIESVEELSIEHKQPWENRSADLFWDLNNIAFSHLGCNKPHENNGTGTYKEGPEGTHWCSTHKKFLSDEMFYKNTKRYSGYSNNCKKCHDLLQGHGIKYGRHSEKSS